MSFILRPGTIPHIQHIYQPSENDWDIGSGLAIEMLDMLDKSINYAHNDDPNNFRVSYKMDDRLSLKVAKIAGNLYVGYKGLNSPYLDSYEQIKFLYKDKQYIINPLYNLLTYADRIIPKEIDNVEVQVGVLWMSENGFGHFAMPYEITPNVVTYKLKNTASTYKMVLSIVSSTSLNPDSSLSFVNDFKPFLKSNFDVLVIDPNIQFANRNYIRDPNKTLKLASNLRQRMLNDGAFRMIKGWESLMCKYFNWLNRTLHEVEQSYVTDFSYWYTNIHTVQVLSKLKLEKNKDKRLQELNEQHQYLMDNYQFFDKAFDLCMLIKYASLELLDDTLNIENTRFTQSKINEGIVLTHAYDNGAQIIYKIVPPEFSQANFEKNKNLYK